MEYTVVVEDGEDGYLIAEVLELPGCRTQAKTTEELRERVREAIQLFLESDPQRRDIRVERIDIQK